MQRDNKWGKKNYKNKWWLTSPSQYSKEIQNVGSWKTLLITPKSRHHPMNPLCVHLLTIFFSEVAHKWLAGYVLHEDAQGVPPFDLLWCLAQSVPDQLALPICHYRALPWAPCPKMDPAKSFWTNPNCHLFQCLPIFGWRMALPQTCSTAGWGPFSHHNTREQPVQFGGSKTLFKGQKFKNVMHILELGTLITVMWTAVVHRQKVLESWNLRLLLSMGLQIKASKGKTLGPCQRRVHLHSEIF